MPKPLCVTIHVPDLWRLQAQRGVFLAYPYSHFERVVYRFDRILFPHSPPTAIDREKIYPVRKSHLEIMLEHWFADERLRSASRLLKESFGERYVSLAEVADDERWSYWSSAITRDLDRLRSWDPEDLRPWAVLPDERYANRTSSTGIRMDIDRLAFARDHLSEDARRRIRGLALAQINESVRQEPIEWSLVTSAISPESDPVVAPELYSALTRLWDGLRRLPLRDEQIAIAVETCVAFWAESEVVPNRGLRLGDSGARAVLGHHRYVEVGGAGGYSKSYVSARRLKAAIRPDLVDFLAQEFRARFEDDPSVIVEWAWKVDYLYELPAFADLVATEMAPYQVLFRSSDPVFFSPARIERIGA
jgi:hypothetical protein